MSLDKCTCHPISKPSESKPKRENIKLQPKKDEFTQTSTQSNSNIDATQKLVLFHGKEPTLPAVNHPLNGGNVTAEQKINSLVGSDSFGNDIRKSGRPLGGTASKSSENKSSRMSEEQLCNEYFTETDIKTKIRNLKVDSNADNTHEPPFSGKVQTTHHPYSSLPGSKIAANKTENCKTDQKIFSQSSYKIVVRDYTGEEQRSKTTKFFEMRPICMPRKGEERIENLIRLTEQTERNVSISEKKTITKTETMYKTETLTKHRNVKTSLISDSMQCGTLDKTETIQRKQHCTKASINLMNRRTSLMSTNSHNVATRKHSNRKSIRNRISSLLTKHPQEFDANIVQRRIVIRVAHKIRRRAQEIYPISI